MAETMVMMSSLLTAKPAWSGEEGGCWLLLLLLSSSPSLPLRRGAEGGGGGEPSGLFDGVSIPA
jgi:hypothetical protein